MIRGLGVWGVEGLWLRIQGLVRFKIQGLRSKGCEGKKEWGIGISMCVIFGIHSFHSYS